MVSLLADFRSLPGLLGIYEELSRREKVGRVEGLLDAGHWELADEAVKEVAGWVADHRRLACRLAVLRARALGAVPFAEEVARSWADTVAAFGSQAYGLLEAAIAGAWERQETAVVRKLEEIARRVIRTADLPTGVRSPLQDWLRWLQVEQALDEGASATSLRQLSVYAREQEASAHLRTRLLRCVKRWRQRDALVALAWAFQAFPELFAVGEADPGEELAAQGLKAAGLALLEVRARADIQRVEVAELHQQIERRERDWRDLDDYLNLVPHKVARAPIPEEIFRVRDLLGSLLRAFEAVEHLESCDLRSAAAESLWNSTRLLLLQDLKDLPVTTGLLRRLDRLQPLTRMEFFELRLRDTAARCSEPEPQELDQQGLFAETAKWVRLIVERFEKAGLVAGEMWAVVSAEYWRDIPALAGDLQPPADRDLHALVQRFDALEDQEREFREALRQLDADEPWVSADGPFHPESHRRYLDFYPQTRPESRRVFRLFDRFVRVGVRPIILRDGVGSLPAWIADYLNRGVP